VSRSKLIQILRYVSSCCRRGWSRDRSILVSERYAVLILAASQAVTQVFLSPSRQMPGWYYNSTTVPHFEVMSSSLNSTSGKGLTGDKIP
jgi:hypothetical protein